jgi:hypothetical protein
MWSGLLLFVGVVAAFLFAWIGFAAIPLIIFYVVVIAVDAGARSRSGAGPLGFGLMLAVIAIYQGANCQAVTLIEGGVQTCEGGPDVRIHFVVAAIAVTLGAIAIYRQYRRRSGPIP